MMRLGMTEMKIDHVKVLREAAFVSPPRNAEDYAKPMSCAYLLELADEIERLQNEVERERAFKISYHDQLQAVLKKFIYK